MMDRDEELEELAAREDREGEPEPNGLVPVKARVPRMARNVFSLRIGAEELDAIADAAEARGISVGDFIRQAALKEAQAPMENAATPAAIIEELNRTRE